MRQGLFDKLIPLKPVLPETLLQGIGTVVPCYRIARVDAARFIKWVHRESAGAAGRSPEQQRQLDRRIDYLCRRSGIESRYSCCPEFAGGLASTAAHMTMTERMQRYEREVVPLAVWACEQALERAGTAAADITNLVFATCTGFVAPGPDQQVARSLSNRR